MAWPSPIRLTPSAANPGAVVERACFGFSDDEIEAQVAAVEARYLPPSAGAKERNQFRDKLHLEELLLARACARGDNAAWEEFERRFRQRLRLAARGLTRDLERAEELADGLWADLFGLKMREGVRVSKLDSYQGIGSLEGWLCALLAQANVDRWRRERRLVGLEEDETLRGQLVPAGRDSEIESNDLRPHLEAALAAVLSGLGAPERLLLSLYFLDGKTLAEIGALLRVHESTISRRLERLLTRMRKQTRRELNVRGLRLGAAEAALQLDPRVIRLDISRSLKMSDPAHSVPP